MKKSLVFIYILILICSLTFVSAFSFSEFWNKITGNVIDISNQPYCYQIGTRSEGWSNNEGFIKYDNCADCEAVCLYGNTEKEGWYSSCDESLIKLENCEEGEIVLKCNSGQKIGDVDGDGNITLLDANLTSQIYVNLISSPENICCADVDKNGEIDIVDFLKISRIAQGLEESPGVCEGEENICTDSDGGKKYYEKGIVYDIREEPPSIADFCYDNESLFEYWCEDSGYSSSLYNCPNGCEDGACVVEVEEDFSYKCLDGTFVYNCSVTKPKYCNNLKELVNNCIQCGCSENQICQEDGSCEIAPNKKSMSQYSDKEVFLISDKNWRDVLPLVPVTTWTGSEECQKGYGTPENVCVYPTLIYHEEVKDVRIIDEDNLHLYVERIHLFDMSDLFIEEEHIFKENFIEYSFSLTNGGLSEINFVLHIEDTNLKYFSFYSDNLDFRTGALSSWNILGLRPMGQSEFSILPGETKEYSFSIGNGAGGFDADSIIYFMQQYFPSKVTMIGETPQELDNLLVSSVGAGLNENQIQRIDTERYLSYWESFDTFVYVKDNYELALLASTYASLINAPLIIQNTELDIKSNFIKRNVICVGDVGQSGINCAEKYNLESLRKRYMEKTRTDKIILVNINDNDILQDNPFVKLFPTLSLSSPILASAKHEVIMSINAPYSKTVPDLEIGTPNSASSSGRGPYQLGFQISHFHDIDSFIEKKIKQFNFGYLTIIADFYAIPHTLDFIKFSVYALDKAIDASYYADINGDNLPDVAVGRINGFSISDVSSYMARDLLYNNFENTNNMKFMASSFDYRPIWSLAGNTRHFAHEFANRGYNVDVSTSYEECYKFSPSEWVNQDVIYYADHASLDWAGISSSDIPKLSNSLVNINGCNTVSDQVFGFNNILCGDDGKILECDVRFDSFWGKAINQGAIAYLGATSVMALGQNWKAFLRELYNSNEEINIGTAFKRAYSREITQGMMILLGDPTFSFPSSPCLSTVGQQCNSGEICCSGLHFGDGKCCKPSGIAPCSSSSECCPGTFCIDTPNNVKACCDPKNPIGPCRYYPST